MEQPQTDARAGAGGEPQLGWLFLDLNSYFASVEQELRPELRGRPVAVVPVKADSGTCIAASYEAKAFGVKTGVKVGDARRMCPGIEFVEARHKLYVDYHHRIVQAVEHCIPVSAVLSIDEMACSLKGRERGLMRALELGHAVKESVRTRAGSTLRCSVGLAPNRYLAKIASDMEKPDGLVALTHDVLHGALSGLQLRDLPGVGAQMERRLRAAGIATMPQLLALDREKLRAVWNGTAGDKLWWMLRGEDFHEERAEHQKSLSQSHVLPPELRNAEGAYAVLHRLVHKAAMRLRAARLWTTHVGLTVKFAVSRTQMQRRHGSGIPQTVWSQGMNVVECHDTQTLIEAVARLWAMRPHGAQHGAPFYVGISFDSLVPDHMHTLSLFEENEGAEGRRSRLAKAMDAVNVKYGTDMVGTANMLLAKAAAPTRIAFTNIPDLF